MPKKEHLDLYHVKLFFPIMESGDEVIIESAFISKKAAGQLQLDLIVIL